MPSRQSKPRNIFPDVRPAVFYRYSLIAASVSRTVHPRKALCDRALYEMIAGFMSLTRSPSVGVGGFWV